MPRSYDPTPAREVFEQRFTFIAGFRRNVERYANRPALVEASSGRRWTYAELGADVERLAGGLAAGGVRKGDVVGFQLLNGPAFALSYLAAQRLGAIASPVNYRFSPGETAHVLDDSEPAAYLFDSSLAGSLSAALGISAHRPSLIVAVGSESAGTGGAHPEASECPAGAAEVAGAVSLEELLAAGHEAPEGWEGTAWEESTRLYTSGTTGMPKGVPLPAVAEVLTAHDVIMHFPLGPEDRTLNMTPWFHRGGISPGGPNALFYVGAAAVTMRQFDAETCLDLVESEQLSYLIGAPTNLALLADAQAVRARDLGSLRGVVTMGAPLERAACLRYQELLTPRIFNGYGTTEAFWNTFLRPGDLPEHAGSAGRACTDDDVTVVAVHDDRLGEPEETVPRDATSIGEVIVRSPKSGYAYHGAADSAEKFHRGWLYAGDLATWDADGFVTIVGRKDDMIISGGENVHPVQVEEVLNEHPGVADSAVVGLPDSRWGEVVVAVVVKADPALTASDCDKHCVAHPMLADYKRPRAYRFVDQLPRTATGKKMHYVLREELRSPGGAESLERP